MNTKNGQIEIYLDKKNRTIIFADNGSGIEDSIRPYLFQAGYSLKLPASGLGLYICKTYLHDINADIYETKLRDRLKNLDGAQFTIDFERVPEHKEEA